MRRFPPPLSVTRPPPSRTTCELALRTFAVAAIVIVTGAAPQSNVMIPPLATALTTAAEVQLAGVPVPTVRVGWLVSTARAAAGTAACPARLPGFGSVVLVTGFADGGDDEDGTVAGTESAAGGTTAEGAPVAAGGAACGVALV
jgi:hypothetical protein